MGRYHLAKRNISLDQIGHTCYRFTTPLIDFVSRIGLGLAHMK